jgi:chemotaxis protein CheX
MDQLEQYIKPFVDVTVDTFNSFVGCEVEPRHPYFSSPNQDTATGVSGITGIIGFSGYIRGAVVLSMRKDMAIRTTGLLIGTDPADLDADVIDAMGEIVNIIAGNIKAKIPDGEKIVISLPAVIKGADHSIAWPSKQGRILCIPFRIFEDGVFQLLVSLDLESR